MRIGILGTGAVGRAHAARLVEKGYEVTMGTRNPAATLARTEAGPRGQEPFATWHAAHPNLRMATFSDGAASADMVINATLGSASLEALNLAGADNIAGKILIDISNPLDFSHGMPASLFVSNTDSLGEQIQRAFPEARVVKTLNTATAPLQVNPAQLAGGDHDIFISGNDPAAKAEVSRLLEVTYGWRRIIDLGDITTARGAEMIMPIWLRLFQVIQTPFFNFKVVGYEPKR